MYVFQWQEGSWRIIHDQNTTIDFHAFASAAGIEKSLRPLVSELSPMLGKRSWFSELSENGTNVFSRRTRCSYRIRGMTCNLKVSQIPRQNPFEPSSTSGDGFGLRLSSFLSHTRGTVSTFHPTMSLGLPTCPRRNNNHLNQESPSSFSSQASGAYPVGS